MEDNKMERKNQDLKAAQERANIIRNTPDGADPVIYWHTVAMDAIRSAERWQVKEKTATAERDNARSDLDRFSNRLIDETARKRSQSPLDLSNLIRMAGLGEIDLNLNISIARGSNNNE